MTRALDWAPSTRAPRSTISASSSSLAALASSAATSAIAVARWKAASRCSACRRASVTSRIAPKSRTGSPLESVTTRPWVTIQRTEPSRRRPRDSDVNWPRPVMAAAIDCRTTSWSSGWM